MTARIPATASLAVPQPTDLFLPLIPLVPVAVYHVILVYNVRTHPNSTVFGLSSASRSSWVSQLLQGNKEILAVQQMRNLIMVSTIMASGTVVAAIGTCNLFASSSAGVQNHTAQMWVLLLLLGLAFFCFAQAMRYFNLVTLGLTVRMLAWPHSFPEHPTPTQRVNSCCQTPSSASSDSQEVTAAADLLTTSESSSLLNHNDTSIPHDSIYHHHMIETNEHMHAVSWLCNAFHRGALFHTLGMRSSYCLFPVLASCVGCVAMVGTTGLLLGLLYVSDYFPGVEFSGVITDALDGEV
ncbi:hypothetical protein CcCBS67573_g05712 [Chytriomyces confervae]|uniref:Transmembrane protein n=1 Tax=Chytriomyces confervae TaxID=246404 RepID=A0A507F8Z3_9FUNG|nr:hypothetical protein CcCBS67573_g05712 [Chytriomyces confervae]